jgi:DNA-directed RNA polymerase subunit K/omega
MATDKPKIEFTKYERARILGARGLQISMDAPLLIKVDEKELENLNFDPLKLAEKELDSGVLPISVNKPLPDRREEKLKEIKVEDYDEDKYKEESEDRQVKKEIVKEAKALETADLKTEEEVEESVEEEGIEEELGGADEGGAED